MNVSSRIPTVQQVVAAPEVASLAILEVASAATRAALLIRYPNRPEIGSSHFLRSRRSAPSTSLWCAHVILYYLKELEWYIHEYCSTIASQR